MLERDCSEDRVHDKRAGGLAVARKTTQDVPVPLARLENAGGWLGKPRGNRRSAFLVLAEGPAGAARLRPELGCHIVIQGKRRSHVLML
jgi:hypothetical protein